MRRPRLAVFPKGQFDDLVAGRLSLEAWIDMAAQLDVEGLELYPAFLAQLEPGYLEKVRSRAQARGLEIPMMCSSPDFLDPRPGGFERAVARMRELIDAMAVLAEGSPWRSCRVLSGQRWPGLDRDEAIARAVAGIEELLPYAAERGVHLVLENHYKDGLWTYPEFAQHRAEFLAIAGSISSPWFGINYDPSNAIVAGEDPLELLEAVADRVVSMHASDRRLKPGFTQDDLARYEGVGYPEALQHGVIGQGLNDYDAIFARLQAAGFSGWVSIEDGEGGIADLQASVAFLRRKLERHWPGAQEEERP